MQSLVNPILNVQYKPELPGKKNIILCKISYLKGKNHQVQLVHFVKNNFIVEVFRNAKTSLVNILWFPVKKITLDCLKYEWCCTNKPAVTWVYNKCL